MHIWNFIKRTGFTTLATFGLLMFTGGYFASSEFGGTALSDVYYYIKTLYIVGLILFFVLAFSIPHSPPIWKDGQRHLVRTLFLSFLAFALSCIFIAIGLFLLNSLLTILRMIFLK